MYKDKRPKLKLSQCCWECLEIVKDVLYANNYVYFLANNMIITQKVIRKTYPNIKDDWLRLKIDDKTLTFSISDGAINSYNPKIREFSSFGYAVKVLGAYEFYTKKIAEISFKKIPEKIELFRKDMKMNHNKKITNEQSCVKIGRGIYFFSEVFGFKPHPAYKPSLNFMFVLRNTTVHNSGIIDKQLVDASNNEFVEIDMDFEIGKPIKWNFSLVLQLNYLMTTILPEADPYISNILELPTIEERAFWYLDK